MPDRVLAMPAPGPSTVDALRAELAAVLARAGIADARQEANDLLAALHDAPRFWPAMHREARVAGDVAARARAAAARRAAGTPFAYAVGRAAFRHLTLDVDERVLIPRQETEQLVDHVLRLAPAGGIVADIGTGSGAIALALASEGRYARVVATDVSRDALVVAAGNVRRLAPQMHAPVELRHGSLLAPLRERVGAIVSNPPYIALTEAADLPPAVRDWEPPVALFGGADGLRVIARIVRHAPRVLAPDGLLALEVDARRAEEVARIAEASGAYRAVRILPDLTGRARFLVAHAATTDGAGRRSPQME